MGLKKNYFCVFLSGNNPPDEFFGVPLGTQDKTNMKPKETQFFVWGSGSKGHFVSFLLKKLRQKKIKFKKNYKRAFFKGHN
jgi:hypothetical protein